MPNQDHAYRQFQLESPWGWWTLCSTETHVVSLSYEGVNRREEAQGDLSEHQPETKLEKQLDCMLARYFRGEVVDFTRIPVDYTLVSPFSAQVLSLLRTVPFGEVQHYQWLAEKLGKPKASRAVGRALGGNPWPIIVPCHRIVSKAGTLGGFMRNCPEGPGIKTGLLALEGVTFPASSSKNAVNEWVTTSLPA